MGKARPRSPGNPPRSGPPPGHQPSPGCPITHRSFDPSGCILIWARGCEGVQGAPRPHREEYCEKLNLKAAVSPSVVFHFYSNAVTGEALISCDMG